MTFVEELLKKDYTIRHSYLCSLTSVMVNPLPETKTFSHHELKGLSLSQGLADPLVQRLSRRIEYPHLSLQP